MSENVLDMCQRKLRLLGYQFDNDAGEQTGDTMIIVGGNRADPIFAHKSVLTSESTVLSKIFQARTGEQQIGALYINDASLKAIRAMIRFFYIAEVDFTEAPAEELAEVALKYDVARLRMVCEEHLAKTINIENMTKRLLFAKKFDSSIILAAAIKFFKANFDDAVPGFMSECCK